MTEFMNEALQSIEQFLPCPTPMGWVEAALEQQEVLLIDHAHCEKKAASTALNLMFRYVERSELLQKMSRLAREELRHFEQVLALLNRRKITYRHLTASRYAEGLRRHMRRTEPDRLVDVLIVGAIIEARSCERFAKIAPHLDPELAEFYRSLLRSEARHFRHYLELARQYAEEPIDRRIATFLEVEAELISEPDPVFRFHSGVPEQD